MYGNSGTYSYKSKYIISKNRVATFTQPVFDVRESVVDYKEIVGFSLGVTDKLFKSIFFDGNRFGFGLFFILSNYIFYFKKVELFSSNIEIQVNCIIVFVMMKKFTDI